MSSEFWLFGNRTELTQIRTRYEEFVCLLFKTQLNRIFKRYDD